MNLRNSLRQVRQSASRLEVLCRKYKGSIILETKSEDRYLQLCLHDSYGVSRNAILNIDEWLQENSSNLPDIPWHTVPLGYLSRWVNNLKMCFSLEDQLLHAEHITLIQDPIPKKLVSLPSKPCPLLCEDWADDSVNFSMDKTLLFQIPFSLNYILGSSQLPLSQMVNISSGDLLLIKNNMAYLSINHQKSFVISYSDGEVKIVSNNLTENNEGYKGNYNEEILNDWLDLQVDIEFILDSKTVTLAQINNISVGSKLPITSGAEQKIKLLLNKKIFASGELVALEDGSLAVEINKVNPILCDGREHSHD